MNKIWLEGQIQAATSFLIMVPLDKNFSYIFNMVTFLLFFEMGLTMFPRLPSNTWTQVIFLPQPS
jgi:hypothetical protein